jgi:hypothetical protein
VACLALWSGLLSHGVRFLIYLIARSHPLDSEAIAVSSNLTDPPTSTRTMDEARQQRPHSDAPSMPLEALSGLGIDISSVSRSSEDLNSTTTPYRETTPEPAQHSVSPPSTGGLSGSTQAGQSPANLFSPDANKSFSRHSTSYSASLAQQSLPGDPEASLLRKHHSASLYSAYGDFAANHKCESVKGVKGSRRNWLSVITIFLALYSTFLSGVFVVVALKEPKWKAVGTHGRLSPSSAALVTTILAKTVEMSFVTVIIAMIGQDLSRRASSTHRRTGVTLAELNMRSWIMQPGTMISRWESLRYAGLSFLGFVSVAAAVFATLYTPACSALVQPQLRSSSWDKREFYGWVKTKFANEHHIQNECFTPIPEGEDQVERSPTCLSIEHAAMAYKNYFIYLGMWSGKEDSSDLADRPHGTAWFSNDTTVIAPWVGLDHSAAFIYPSTDIIVNNVSLAFPHTGVASAARHGKNLVSQPEDLDGVGRYTINASVASPLLNSLCATVSEEDLAPLIFEKWNMTQETLNHTSWPAQLRYSEAHPSPYLGGTVHDDIFEWGEKYGDYSWPPVFMKLPQEFNTMVNGTGGWGQPYGRSAVYILGRGNSSVSEKDARAGQDYFLCQLQVSQTPYCYTSYQASGQGAVLEAACDTSPPSGQTLRYIEGERNAPNSRVFADRDWPMVASEMALALSLNDGAFEGKSANARLLSQLLLRDAVLDSKRPSLAEALAVLSGCTLLQSTSDAPFIHYWNYTAEEAPDGELPLPGVEQTFNASISAQNYYSGGTSKYQKGFLIVLFGVFALNVLALVYFATHKTWYVDLSEPPNLFSLAVNSPPSEAFSGCCGTGPTGKDYGVSWTLGQDQGHVFVHSGPKGEATGNAEEGTALTKRKVWRAASESPLTRGIGTVRSWGRKS